MLSKRQIERFIKQDDVVESWQTNESVFIIRELSEPSRSGVKWCLDFETLDGMGGGGTPFKTRDELDAYIVKYRLHSQAKKTVKKHKPKMKQTIKELEYEQLLLEI